MFFDDNVIIIRLEHVDMLPFSHYNTELISVIWTEMDTCFLHSMLHFTIALKQGFQRNFIEISTMVDFLCEINCLD